MSRADASVVAATADDRLTVGRVVGEECSTSSQTRVCEKPSSSWYYMHVIPMWCTAVDIESSSSYGILL